MPARKLPPDEELIELYQSGLSCREMGEMFGATKTSVAYHLRKHGVTRTNSETWNLPGRHEPLVERDWLYQKYWVEELSMVDIGEILDRDPKTILYWMRKYDIPTRPRGHNRENLLNGHEPGTFTHNEESKGKIGKASRERRAVPYLRDGEHWLKGAPPEENPNWKGGVTPERQALYNSQEWKEAVKEVWKRDDAICQRCELDHRDVDRDEVRFDIHHIVPFADSVELRAEPSNLALLCYDCHMWVHSNENTEGEYLATVEDAEQQALMPTLFDLMELEPGSSANGNGHGQPAPAGSGEAA